MLYAHSHTFPNSPPLRSRLIFSPPVLARRLYAAPGARGEVSPCPSLPLPTPFRALTGAPSPIRPPKGGSLGVTRTTPRPPAPWRYPPALPLRRLTAAPPPSAPLRGAPWGNPCPSPFPLRLLACRGATPRAPSATASRRRRLSRPPPLAL